MNAYRLIKTITILLIIGLLTAISLFGIYVQREFRVVNVMPEYRLGMEFDGGIVINFNAPEDANEYYFEEAKRIMYGRLNEVSASQFEVRQDRETGSISVAIPENSETWHIARTIVQEGRFEILDSETGEVLMDNSYVAGANVVYGPPAQVRNGYSCVCTSKIQQRRCNKIRRN